MRKLFLLLACAAVAAFISCDKDDDKAEIITVASKTYSGPSYEGNGTFYLIKHKNDKSWTYWADWIKGFDHVEGYEYVLEVVKKKHDPRLMDVGTHYYQLLKVISAVEKDSEDLPVNVN